MSFSVSLPRHAIPPARAHRRGGRAALAFAVVCLHIAAFFALSDIRGPALIARDDLAITWIPILVPEPTPAPTPKSRLDAAAQSPSPLSRKKQPAAPALALPQAPAVDTPQTFTGLQNYVLCGLGSDVTRTPAERERCAGVRRKFVLDDLPLRAPTEEERRRAQQREHDHAVQQAPVLLPCINGGIDILCVLSGAATGGFKMGSYANQKSSRKRGDVPSGPKPGGF